MRSIIKQKKGELTDMLIFLITIFILAVGFFIMIFVVPQITGGLRTAGLNNSAETATAIDDTESIMTGVINYGFAFIFFGLIASLMITSFLVRTHPIFLFLYIFFLAITLLIGVYLGNYYDDLKSNTIFAATLNNASLINLIMNHIVEICLSVGALSMIIVFAKFSTFGGTQQF